MTFYNNLKIKIMVAVVIVIAVLVFMFGYFVGSNNPTQSVIDKIKNKL